MPTYRVISEALNLREGPATNHRVLTKLSKHKILDQFEVSEDGSWYLVRTTVQERAFEGWVAARYVAPQPLALELPVTAPWLAIAEKEIGVTEVPGNANDNTRVVQYLETTPAVEAIDSVPWCSAFVNWCIKKAGLNGTNDARARSWLHWGVALPMEAPRQGCIAVLKRGASPNQGHVGFFVMTKEAGVTLLGGNQGDRVTVASFRPDRLLGYRWPA